MKNIRLVLVSLMLVASLSHTGYSQSRIHLAVDFNKSFPPSYMPDLSGNFDLGYSKLFRSGSSGMGATAGFYSFKKIALDLTEGKYYSVPVDFRLFKRLRKGAYVFEVSPFVGLNVLFGRDTYTQDGQFVDGGSSATIVYKKGDSRGKPSSPGAILGAMIVVSRRFADTELGLRCGYKYLSAPFIEYADASNFGPIGSGFALGFQVSRWLGKNS
jgi:hypothetical protein